MERHEELQRNFQTLTRHADSLAAVVQFQLQLAGDFEPISALPLRFRN